MIGAEAKTHSDLGFDLIRTAWSERTHTERGRESILAVSAAISQQEANERLDRVDEARSLWDRSSAMPFGGISDIRESVGRAQKGSRLDAEELIAIRDAAIGFRSLGEHLQRHQSEAPKLWELGQGIEDFSQPISVLARAFEPDGRLSPETFPSLAALRKTVIRLKQAIESKAKTLLENPRISRELQDSYWTQREDRYVLPVKASSRSKVPGVVHGSSGSGQTVFLEPTVLVELNNDLKLAEFAEEEEASRILKSLSESVGQHADAFLRASDLAAQLDLFAAAAKLSAELSCTRPQITDGGTLSLLDVSHPGMLLTQKDCVANDIRVSDRTVLVISGPNAGGKTVSLKTTGLCVLMTRYGLHIPAKSESSLPWFSLVLSAIGDSQSLESELSTFSAHLRHLRRFMEAAAPGTLILIDEICSATEPEQGAALAQSVLERIADAGAIALTTTHYERLKVLGGEDVRFANASVGFDIERLAPTFRLHLGVPGASAAIDVARRMGLPESVNSRAEELAGTGRTKVDELLRKVADEKERLADERDALEEERRATAKAYEEVQDKMRKARVEARREHDKAHASALQSLRDARDELDRLRKELRRMKRPKRESVQVRSEGVNRAATKVHEAAPKRPDMPGNAPPPDELQVGTSVRVGSLNAEGIVVEPSKDGKRVLVQVGPLKTKVAISDIRLLSKSANSSKKIQQKRFERSTSEVVNAAYERSPDATLDVRGARVHEMEESLQRFIDSSILACRDTFLVIHGHGTGALRQSVREQLGLHPEIRDWRPGESSEGGDGVTIAFLV